MVVYQVYPRSFQDSDGDGIGDIRGITSRLDYIKSLGVDVVWLNPVYQSPNDDNGYDISDYRAIMREMGTMAEFDAMLEGMHRRGIKLIMDLVVNHTSDEHPWFRQSRSSRDNPYRDYYHWWPAERGTPAHRWSFFDEEGSAWRYDSTTRAYYLHYFSRKQPDLKWENPRVRREVYEIMRFWFDKGVDGFRMDVIPFISKDTTFPPLPASYNGNYVAYYAKGPRLHEYLREMNREVLSRYDVMTVGEGGGVAVEDALNLVGDDRHELQTFFQFELVDRWGRRPDNWLYPDSTNRSLPELKRVFTKWDSVFATSGWGTVFLGNHDQSRMVSRYGNDDPRYRTTASKMLHTFLLTMRGTPYIYNGDEIGMANIRFTDIRAVSRPDDDQLLPSPRAGRRGPAGVPGGPGGDQPGQRAHADAVDARTATPASPPGRPGSASTPTIGPSTSPRRRRTPARCCTTSAGCSGSGSPTPCWSTAGTTCWTAENPEVYAYTRSLEGRTLMVALSFSPAGGRTALPPGYTSGRILINNLAASPLRGTRLELAPYQAVVLELTRD